jgi:sulfite reductase (NADPH) flavoprotein alpha-component
MSFTADPARLAAAALLVLAYLLLCGGIAWRQARRRRAARQAASDLMPAAAGSTRVLIAHASQTGTAEELAWQTAAMLHTAGWSARLCALDELDATTLAGAERALFVASTYGEGDPPDAAAVFARRVMASDLAPGALAGLHYAVLALGDDDYAQFCGFGRSLDQWLARQGAAPMIGRVEVNRGDAAALELWRRQLSHIAGTSDLPDWQGPPFSTWRLAARRLLNPGSAGAPTFHVELEPAAAHGLPAWESGDLVQVMAPGDPARPREYSIASLPADGRVHLLIRQHRQPGGSLGAASGWLTAEAAIGDAVDLRIRSHRSFRLGENAGRPLILIGNGTGLAGLRGHLKARIAAGVGQNWLVFGERSAAHDFYYREEVESWLAQGLLARADLAFSRDQSERIYVQDRLRAAAATLQAWLARDAAIYVCGSLAGMAAGVDAALGEILGREGLDALAVAGRYRRDVY